MQIESLKGMLLGHLTRGDLYDFFTVYEPSRETRYHVSRKTIEFTYSDLEFEFMKRNKICAALVNKDRKITRLYYEREDKKRFERINVRNTADELLNQIGIRP